MGYMVLPGTVRCLKLLHRQLAGSDQLRHAKKLLLCITLILVLEPADGLAGGGDVRMKAQVIDAILKRKDLRFSV